MFDQQINTFKLVDDFLIQWVYLLMSGVCSNSQRQGR